MTPGTRNQAFIGQALCCLLSFAAAGTTAVRPASGAWVPAAQKKPASLRSSPPYAVAVTFKLESPFVPDGRASVAELAFRVVFAPVVFEFDPSADPLLGRCRLDTGKVKGVFSKFVLNDIQVGDARQASAFLTPRPLNFTAGLDIESEPTEDEESAATSRTPPSKVRLSFWTDFGAAEVKWGSPLGTGRLENLKTVLEAPFRDFMAGRPRTVTISYEGKYAEDKGTWTVEFTPRKK